MPSPAPFRITAARAVAAAAAALLLLGPARTAPALEMAEHHRLGEPPAVGEAAPDFTLPDTAGRPVRLSDFRGKVVLLTFWSCHTDTCFTSVKAFEELLAKLGPRGLVAPTICEEVPEPLARDGYAGLLRSCSTGQTILIDEKREARGLFKVRQLPTTIVLGPDLTVREVLRGVPALREPAFHARLEALVSALEPAAKP